MKTEHRTKATNEDRRIVLIVMSLSIGLSLGVVAGVAVAAFLIGG